MKTSMLILILLSLVLAACVPSTPVTPTTFIDTGVNPEAWASIQAGEFLMDQHNHETQVDYDYEMMVTDVTTAQYAAYLSDALNNGTIKIVDNEILGPYSGDLFHGFKHEKKIKPGDYLHVPLDDVWLRLNFDGKLFSAIAGYENHPMTTVTWFGAKAYCEYYGWRLPTSVEWEKAARGTDGRPFPWGEHIARNNANYYSSRDLFEKIFGALGDTTPAGFYNGQTYSGYQTLDSPSPYGLYDMAGNVWQWLADIIEGTHYRTMAGGSKSNYEYNLRVWTRNSAGPDYFSTNVGFRCAR